MKPLLLTLLLSLSLAGFGQESVAPREGAWIETGISQATIT
jgi:hypothetical protein